MGILSIFSIGLLLLVVAAIGTVALGRAMNTAARTEISALVPLAWMRTLVVLTLGLILTKPTSGAIDIRCPPQGHWQGNTTSNGTTTNYRCDDGELPRL